MPVLYKEGAVSVLLLPDDETNTTLNASTPGADGIALTNFTIGLWQDGELVSDTIATLQASPFFLTIDNVSGANVGMYKLNITLDTPGHYELFANHSVDMQAFRSEQIDNLTREEIGSLSRANLRYDFTVATVAVPARNVAAGVLDKLRIRRKSESDADFTSPIEDVEVLFTYETTGDTNPTIVSI